MYLLAPEATFGKKNISQIRSATWDLLYEACGLANFHVFLILVMDSHNAKSTTE